MQKTEENEKIKQRNIGTKLYFFKVKIAMYKTLNSHVLV